MAAIEGEGVRRSGHALSWRATASSNSGIKIFSALVLYFVNYCLILGNIGNVGFCELLCPAKFWHIVLVNFYKY